MASASRPPRERDEVVVVAADLVAGQAHARPPRSRRAPGSSLGNRLRWISRAICSSRSWRCFSSCTRCRRTLSSAAIACRPSVCAKSRSSSRERRAGDPLAHGQQAPRRGRPAERDDQRHARAQQALAQRPRRQVGDGRGARRALEHRTRLRFAGRGGPLRRCAGRARGRAPRPPGARQVERAARDHEVAHQRGGHEVLDRLLVEARGQLAADVEQVVELEDLHATAAG